MSTDTPSDKSTGQDSQAEPGPQSVTGPRIDKGLVIVNTGKGKGKTTAALGVTLRSWGRGMNVIVLQFIKHSTANFGEQRAAQKMGIEMRAMGDGFTWRSKDLDQSAELARAHWEDCKAIISAGEDNLFGHPHPETLEALAEWVPDNGVFLTKDHGAIELTTDGKRLLVKTEK